MQNVRDFILLALAHDGVGQSSIWLPDLPTDNEEEEEMFVHFNFKLTKPQNKLKT